MKKFLLFIFMISSLALNAQKGITFTNPNTTTSTADNTSLFISWAENEIGPDDFIRLEYSLDNGQQWFYMIANTASNFNGSYSWLIPSGFNSSETKIRAAINNIPIGESDNFTITSPAPSSLVFTSNYEGETFVAGQSYTINFSGNNLNHLNSNLFNNRIGLFYSVDGQTYYRITYNLSTTANSYNWTVPNTPGTNLFFRVSHHSSNSSNALQSPFFDEVSINISSGNPPQVTFQTPTAASNFLDEDQPHNISFTHENLPTDAIFRLEASLNDGNNWSNLVQWNSGVSPVSPYSWGSISWIPFPVGINSTEAKVKIYATNYPIEFLSEQFTISTNHPKSLTLTYPNGGEAFDPGDQVTVTWTQQSLENQYGEFHVSYDGGLNFQMVDDGIDMEELTYIWSIPDVQSTQVLAKLIVPDWSYQMPATDESDAVFTINEAIPLITNIINPNSTVERMAGTNQNIQYSAYGIDSVNIDYSLDNGATWVNIELNYKITSGQYVGYYWSIPADIESDETRIRISDAGNSGQEAISDAFVIFQPYIKLTNPAAGEILTPQNIYQINYEVNTATGDLLIEYSLDGGVNWIQIYSGSYWSYMTSYNWSVPNVVSWALIRISRGGTKYTQQFRIGSIPSLSLLKPEGNVDYPMGSDLLVEWTSSDITNADNTFISLSKDGGTTYQLVDQKAYVAGNDELTITLPQEAVEEARIKVEVKFNDIVQIEAISNQFSIIIGDTTLTLINPKGGEVYAGDDLVSVLWETSFDSYFSNLNYLVNLTLVTTEGAGQIASGTGVPNSEITGNFPAVSPGFYRVLVSYHDPLIPRSFNVFSEPILIDTVQLSIEINNPIENTTASAKKLLPIDFSIAGHSNNNGTYDLSLSLDGGNSFSVYASGSSSYGIIHDGIVLPDGDYPNALLVLSVNDAFAGNTASDTMAFSIEPDPFEVSITAPTTNETVDGGATYNVSFDVDGLDNPGLFDIKLSLNGDMDFTSLQSGNVTVDGSYQYMITMPNEGADNAQLSVAVTDNIIGFTGTHTVEFILLASDTLVAITQPQADHVLRSNQQEEIKIHANVASFFADYTWSLNLYDIDDNLISTGPTGAGGSVYQTVYYDIPDLTSGDYKLVLNYTPNNSGDIYTDEVNVKILPPLTVELVNPTITDELQSRMPFSFSSATTGIDVSASIVYRVSYDAGATYTDLWSGTTSNSQHNITLTLPNQPPSDELLIAVVLSEYGTTVSDTLAQAINFLAAPEPGITIARPTLATGAILGASYPQVLVDIQGIYNSPRNYKLSLSIDSTKSYTVVRSGNTVYSNYEGLSLGVIDIPNADMEAYLAAEISNGNGGSVYDTTSFMIEHREPMLNLWDPEEDELLVEGIHRIRFNTQYFNPASDFTVYGSSDGGINYSTLASGTIDELYIKTNGIDIAIPREFNDEYWIKVKVVDHFAQYEKSDSTSIMLRPKRDVIPFPYIEDYNNIAASDGDLPLPYTENYYSVSKGWQYNSQDGTDNSGAMIYFNSDPMNSFFAHSHMIFGAFDISGISELYVQFDAKLETLGNTQGNLTFGYMNNYDGYQQSLQFAGKSTIVDVMENDILAWKTHVRNISNLTGDTIYFYFLVNDDLTGAAPMKFFIDNLIISENINDIDAGLLPQLTLNYPAGGEVLTAGQAIAFNVSIENTVELSNQGLYFSWSPDQGTSWNVLNQFSPFSYVDGTANYALTLPVLHQVNNEVLFAASITSGGVVYGDTTTLSTSVNPIPIDVELTSRNEAMLLGSNQNISFSVTGASLNTTYELFISYDGGLNYSSLSTGVAVNGTNTVSFSPNMISNNARIKIALEDLGKSMNAEDISGKLLVYDPNTPIISVIEPIIFSEHPGLDMLQFKFYSYGFGFNNNAYNVYLSVDDGVNYELVHSASSTANPVIASFPLENFDTNVAKIKVEKSTGVIAYNDVSEVFTIQSVIPPSIQFTYPAGGEVFPVDSDFNALYTANGFHYTNTNEQWVLELLVDDINLGFLNDGLMPGNGEARVYGFNNTPTTNNARLIIYTWYKGFNYSDTTNVFSIINNNNIPVLVAPANGINQQNLATILQWEALADFPSATFQVQISTDPNFTFSQVNETGIAQTSITVSNFNYGTNYWRVRSENTPATSNWSEVRTINILKENQLITFLPIEDRFYGDADFQLIASASSGLPVTFELLNGPAQLTGNQISILGAGEVTIRASQQGSDVYNPAPDVVNILTTNRPRLLVKAVNDTITYGDEIPALTYTISGFVNGEDESVLTNNVTIATTAIAISETGVYPIVVSSAAAANYDFIYEEGVLLIEKADQTIKFDELHDIVLNGSKVIQLNASASSGLEVSFELVSGPAILNGSSLEITGTGVVTIKAIQAGNSDHYYAEASQSFNITGSLNQEQSISFEPISDKRYGDSGFTIQATASSGLPVTYELLSGSALLTGNELTIEGVGTITVMAYQSGDALFAPSDTSYQSFMVIPAVLTVTAHDQLIAYGSPIPALTHQITGFVNGEDESALTTGVQLITSADEDSNAGSYPITANGAAADNYTFEYEDGTLTIKKAEQHIDFALIPDVDLLLSQELVLHATASSGLPVNYELVSGVATLVNGNVLALTGIGTVSVKAVQAGNDNYQAAEATQLFEVYLGGIDDLPIVINIPDKTYGDNSFTLEAPLSIEQSVSYELISGPVMLNSNEVTIAGTGEVVIAVLLASEEFPEPVPMIHLKFLVHKANLEVVANDVQVVYNEEIPSLTYSLQGLVYSDDATILLEEPLLSTNAVTGSDVGEYEIQISGGDALNYNLNYVGANLLIVKADQVISVEPIPDQLNNAEPIEVAASTTSGLSLTYSVSGPAQINENFIILDGVAGTVELTISQEGNNNYNGAELIISFQVTGTVGFKEMGMIQVSIFPNPVDDILIIETNDIVIKTIDIYDVRGRLIYEHQAQKGRNEMNLSRFMPGVYFLKFDELDYMHKVIIKR